VKRLAALYKDLQHFTQMRICQRWSLHYCNLVVLMSQLFLNRCLLTHNRVDFERLHLQYTEQGKQHSGIIVIPQKNAYEVAQRVGILVSALTLDEITNQLLYA
jgi:hypothetical protein